MVVRPPALRPLLPPPPPPLPPLRLILFLDPVWANDLVRDTKILARQVPVQSAVFPVWLVEPLALLAKLPVPSVALLAGLVVDFLLGTKILLE